jgi:hypothetical protein
MPKKHPGYESENYRNVRAGKKRNEIAVAAARELADDRKLFELRQQGLTEVRIAEQMGMSPSMVNGRLQKIFQTYRVGLTGDVEARAGEMISRYEYIINESMDAWRASKDDRRSASRTVTRRLGDGGVTVDEATGEVISNPEDPGTESMTTGASSPGPDVKYLSTAMSAMEKLGKLLRIDSPTQVQVQVSGEGGGPVRIIHDINYDELEGEKLGAYMRGLADAALVASQPLIKVIEHDPADDPAGEA